MNNITYWIRILWFPSVNVVNLLESLQSLRVATLGHQELRTLWHEKQSYSTDQTRQSTHE